MNSEHARPQVLLVEDEPWIRELWIEELSDMDRYEVIAVACAAPALAVLAETNVDAAIIDIGLPQMSGEALIAAVRHNHPALPILAVTGFDATHYRHLSENGICVLQKPFRSSWLLFNLNTALARRKYDEQHMGQRDRLRAAC